MLHEQYTGFCQSVFSNLLLNYLIVAYFQYEGCNQFHLNILKGVHMRVVGGVLLPMHNYQGVMEMRS